MGGKVPNPNFAIGAPEVLEVDQSGAGAKTLRCEAAARQNMLPRPGTSLVFPII
jgi:hypothetical protein